MRHSNRAITTVPPKYRCTLLPDISNHAPIDSMDTGSFRRLVFGLRHVWHEETCIACDRNVVISGQFTTRAWGVTTIEGAPRHEDEAFREEIYGTNSPCLCRPSAGQYTVQIGLWKLISQMPGQRVFDISCDKQVLPASRHLRHSRRRGKSVFCHRPGGTGGRSPGRPLSFESLAAPTQQN